MRRILSLVIVLTAGLCALGVPSAVAGGPTSVLVVNLVESRSAAALNGSTAYTELQSILGDENPPAAATPPRGLSGSGDATIRMVWLIHDVTPWRIDNVHVDGADTWVETYLNATGSDPYAAAPIWHQPARGADLTEAFTALGVVGTGSSAGTTSTSALGAVSPSIEPAGAGSSTVGAPWWLAAGLTVLGFAGGTALGRRVGPRLGSPRQVAAMG